MLKSILRVLTALVAVGAFVFAFSPPAGAVSPSQDACHTVNNNAPIGNCGPFDTTGNDTTTTTAGSGTTSSTGTSSTSSTGTSSTSSSSATDTDSSSSGSDTTGTDDTTT